VLGNYSLTLIDSLSTLAILASAPPDEARTGAKALRDFQGGIAALVVEYGDGTDGPSGQGLRGRGFDMDSKVQVFETVIRGVGGLLSAHLFAVGELPIDGYKPRRASYWTWKGQKSEAERPIIWPNNFKYDGQLLRLALDLAQRLLPAFYTNTGMPYPRVNLRHGIPFYHKSPLNQASGTYDYDDEGPQEITETCSAGAGSLVLEFTVLSRLTGDPRFEQLAKRAFWAVWARRSHIGLIGAGIDAEGGHWVGAYSGIGAGTDSFFEYALKTHILTSGLELPNTTVPFGKKPKSWLDPNTIYRPLSAEENSPDSFLYAWKAAHGAIKRHLYSSTHHPHYVNVHLGTGSPQAYWIDSLGAYYPGLLTLAGELEEAIETNLLYTALWTRYAALPERWSVRDGTIEGGLGWWPGRPEFIESNYHLYRATKDPWYLHVVEMVLKDIQSRCWTRCGWSGLQDVQTGEKSDRMESFFLGETAKYMYLLFDPDHPLNSLDAPYVFTTEGHPLIIPRKPRAHKRNKKPKSSALQPYVPAENAEICPVPPAFVPLTISATAARPDVFHAASLIGLHHIPNLRVLDTGFDTDAGISSFDQEEPYITPNHTFYPWTLPQSLIPSHGVCSRLPVKTTFTIEFPSNAQLANHGFNLVLGPQMALARVNGEGILVKNLAGVKLGMIQEDIAPIFGHDDKALSKIWRILNIGSMALGRDEKVFISRDTMGPILDPSFTRVRDPTSLDLVIQLENPEEANSMQTPTSSDLPADETEQPLCTEQTREPLHFEEPADLPSDYRTMLSSLLHQVTSALRDPVATLLPQQQPEPLYHSILIPALAPTGIGAAPLPPVPDAPDPSTPSTASLPWTSVYFADEACEGKLPDDVARRYNVIVMRRGGCTFSRKLARVPVFSPGKGGLQVVVVVSEGEEGDEELVRPLLDEVQRTPGGMRRVHEVPMVMVGGGEATWESLRRARSVGVRRRYWVESAGGLRIGNLIVV